MALAFMERGELEQGKATYISFYPTSQFPHYFSGFRAEK
jgi:hypothetical protein